LFDLTTLAI